MFIGSQLAGERAAMVMSLLQSAKLNGRDPWAYLKDVLTRLPTHPNSRIEDLLPHRWQPPPHVPQVDQTRCAQNAASRWPMQATRAVIHSQRASQALTPPYVASAAFVMNAMVEGHPPHLKMPRLDAYGTAAKPRFVELLAAPAVSMPAPGGLPALCHASWSA